MSNSLIGGGQFSGPSATPLGQGLSAALGLQGGELPGMPSGVGQVVPVALVVDTSDRVSRAIIEARALALDLVAVPAGRRIKLQLTSGGGGGAIVRRIWFEAEPGATQTFLTVAFGVSPATPFASFVAVGAQTPLNVGGQPTESQLRVGQGLPDLVGRLLQLRSGSSQGLFSGGPVSVDWFLPPGTWVAFQGSDDGVDTAYFFEWLEVPE